MPAAIATLGVAGPEALTAIARFVRLPDAGLEVGSVRFATWRIPLNEPGDRPGRQPNSGSVSPPPVAGEHVVLTRPAEDRIEIHCHGGAAVCQRLLSDLMSVGCSAVPSQQWPSQLSCPLARAAEQDLLLVTTDRAAAILLDQMNGALRADISAARRQLAERDSSRLRALLNWADFGLHLAQAWKVVLAGPPNVGKSSLLNALAGTRQAIVHHEAGTTRDWIEWPSAVDGWPVVFTDTAGVRQSTEAIERTGVERGLGQLRDADLAVLVVDAQQGWTEAHTQLLPICPARRLIVYNKVDLGKPAAADPRPPTQVIMGAGGGGDRPLVDGEVAVGQSLWPLLHTSAVDGTGIDALLQAISQALVPQSPAAGAGIPFRAAQVQWLSQSWQSVQTGDWAAAAARLEDCLS